MRFVLVALALGLAGCVTEQGSAQFTQFVETTRRDPVPETSSLYQAVTVGKITGGRVGNASPDGVARDQDLQSALSSMLTGRSMLASSAGRYRLDANIVRSSYPQFAMSTIEVTTRIDYALVNASSGAIIFRSTVEAKESTPFSSSPIFATRIALSTVQSLAQNATIALDKIVAASGSGEIPAP